MKRTLLALLLFSAAFVQAQDTLTTADYPVVGDSFFVNNVLFDETNIPWTVFNTAQTQFSYDLSNIIPTERDTDIVEKPGDLDGGNQISGADYGFAYGIGNAFLKNTSENIEMVGLSPQLDLPLTLAFQFDSVLTFMDGPEITHGSTMTDATTSDVQIPFVYDINAEIEMEYEVNGYGQLTIPGDTTFDVIRLRRVTHFFAIAKQLLTSQVDTIVDSMVTWEFYTPGYSSTVLRIDVSIEEIGANLDTFALFSFYGDDIVFTGKAGPYNTNTFTARVNTFAEDVLKVEATEAVRMSVYDLKGAIHYRSDEPIVQRSVNVSHLESGYYLVVLHGEKGSLTKKIFKN